MNGGGKLVKRFGKLGGIYQWPDGRRYFWKSVDRSKHFMRKNQSWAISSDIVEELKLAKVEYIYLEVRGETVLSTSMDEFLRYSIIEKYRDYEEQNFLHASHWYSQR